MQEFALECDRRPEPSSEDPTRFGVLSVRGHRAHNAKLELGSAQSAQGVEQWSDLFSRGYVGDQDSANPIPRDVWPRSGGGVDPGLDHRNPRAVDAEVREHLAKKGARNDEALGDRQCSTLIVAKLLAFEPTANRDQRRKVVGQQAHGSLVGPRADPIEKQRVDPGQVVSAPLERVFDVNDRSGSGQARDEFAVESGPPGGRAVQGRNDEAMSHSAPIQLSGQSNSMSGPNEKWRQRSRNASSSDEISGRAIAGRPEPSRTGATVR